jgi:putative nucleotidyltransferase with HDIG domain
MTLLKNKETVRNLLDDYTRDWQVLINALPYPVSIIDTEFNIIMANKAMAIFYGRTDMPDNPKCYQLIHHSDNPIENCPMLMALKSRKSEQAEIYVPSLKKHLIINASPIITDGILIGVIHSFFDITETKKDLEDDKELIEIYASSINKLKSRELRAQKGRDAFLNMLEDISESYKELEDLFLKLILVMVNALDAKSPWTKGHSERVSIYGEQIAEEMLIDADEIKNIRLAGLLHDIGKIGTYDYLLNKPGRLSKEEFDIVKRHPAQGADILKDIKQLRDIIPFIKYHHEKIDGNGYPYKLKGESIPLGARILHVADSFDSMTSDRPYRPSPGIEYALSELKKYKGTQFDNEVVEAFLRALDKSGKWETKLSSK